MSLIKHNILKFFYLKEFCNNYNITIKQLKTTDIYYFRYLCFMFNEFIKHMVLPKIKKDSLYEAVLIEFRNFPHIEFLIRNAILKLGQGWSHTVMCGNLNYEMVNNICTNISPDIRIVKLNENNITQTEYSFFLTTETFWNHLKGDKILIYQEDSIIFKNNIQDFLEYDFIGAPFFKQSNDTPNQVGNGGLSIRTKSKMLEIIKKNSVNSCKFNSSTLNYMKFVNLEYPPEDVYFSKSMQENNVGDVANWNAAYEFSSEAIFNPNSFGGHKFWISCNNWKTHMKKKFNYFIYKPKSNLKDYLNFLGIDFLVENININAFDIDLYFYCKTNNLDGHNQNVFITCECVKQFGLRGLLYHPKQLFNIYSNIELYQFLNNIYVFYKNVSYNIQDFTSKYVYNLEFQQLSDCLITKKYSCLNNNYDILLLVFIGNERIGLDLVNRFIEYKKIENKFNIAFCINSNIKRTILLKKLIKQNFDYYAIYKSKELGNDITPTLLMYNDIFKTQHFRHILKFHTKSIRHAYLNLTNYLLSVPIKELLNLNTNDYSSNCIGYPEYYTHLDDDVFNNDIKKEHSKIINKNNYFIAGTIFYASSLVFDKIIDFIKENNYKGYLLNNMYDNNSVNKDYSPIHFLERLFGVIFL